MAAFYYSYGKKNVKRNSQIILIGIIFVLISSSRATQKDTGLPAGFDEKPTKKYNALTLQAATATHHSIQTSDTHDSMMIRKLVNELKGIELYFVFNNNFRKMTEGLKMLLEYKQLSMPPLLQTVATHFRITSIDENLRLMNIECIDCETSRRMSYWDIEDGSVLIGTVEKGCGPLCSYQIEFSVFRNGTMEKIDKTSVMPSISLSDFLSDPAEAEAIISGTAYEMPIRLRNNGNDLSVGLWLDEPDKYIKKLRGDLIPFTWNGMNFYRGEIVNSRQR